MVKVNAHIVPFSPALNAETAAKVERERARTRRIRARRKAARLDRLHSRYFAAAWNRLMADEDWAG